MNNVKVTIPVLTFLKMFLRGCFDLSFIYEISRDIQNLRVGDRAGIRTLSGVVAYYEKVDESTLIVVSVYQIGKENDNIQDRAIALSKILTSFLTSK